MKTIILGIVIVSTATFAFGQARPGIYPWSVTFKVVDDAGRPMGAAKVDVGYLHTNQIEGQTDSDGVFAVSNTDKSFELGFLVTKEGYYSDYLHYDLFMPGQFDERKVAANRNSTQMMTLRHIGKQIPMYAKRVETKLQQEDKPTGFDLMAGDWVTPFGKGFHPDMFFTVHRKIINEREYNCTLTVTFPNKGDGIVVAPSEPITGSAFKTSRTAAKNGYEPELDLHYSNTNSPESVFGYFIRVRTIFDENGNVRSALYGKIPGNFRFYAGTKAPRAGMGFDYYLNLKSNDRNLEFDPKQNLIKDLKFEEVVREP